MGWSALTECRCGHVANHHLGPNAGYPGCQVRGCPCRRFVAADRSRMDVVEHNAVVHKANRLIQEARDQRDKLREQVKAMGGDPVA